MNRWAEYHLATTVEEALHLLAAYDGEARVIAGGTDLMIDLEMGEEPAPKALVDITRVDALHAIRLEGPWVVLGAAVTHSRIVRSDLLWAHATCLVEACGVIGGPQVRNMGTIGGNVAHALPAADGTVALMALEAEAQVARLTPAGEVTYTWHPLGDLFLGPGRSAVDSRRELITAFRFPARRPREGSAFDRIMRPQGVALPILGVAARVQLSEDGERFERVRVCLGPAGPVPFRARETEAALTAHPVNDATLEQAIRAALAEARLRTSKHRATRAYREEMVRVLLRRVIPKAVARARAGTQTPTEEAK